MFYCFIFISTTFHKHTFIIKTNIDVKSFKMLNINFQHFIITRKKEHIITKKNNVQSIKLRTVQTHLNMCWMDLLKPSLLIFICSGLEVVRKQNGDKIDSIIKVTKFGDLYKWNLDCEPDSIKIKYDGDFCDHIKSLTNEEANKLIELPKYACIQEITWNV